MVNLETVKNLTREELEGQYIQSIELLKSILFDSVTESDYDSDIYYFLTEIGEKDQESYLDEIELDEDES